MDIIKPLPPKRSKKRPTIGYLGGSMIIEQLFQTGLIDASKAANINLIIFAGGVLENPNKFDAQRSNIFKLVNPNIVDGLIIGSDFLGHYVGAEKILEFCERYKPLPIVKNEPLIEGYPTLLFNFYQGMYDIVSHLIEAHHFSRIGFISGPEQSNSIKDRFRAYQDALADHSISFDESLIVAGTIFAPSGDEAIRIFLDERELEPGVDIEAIVAFNDFIAVDALNSLHARGISVPDEIAIVGFDDDEITYVTNPSLTTVRLPFYEMGSWCVDIMATVFEGNTLPEVTTIAAPPVIRQSCGCKPPVLTHKRPELNGPFEDIDLPIRYLHQKRVEIYTLMLKAAGFRNIPRMRNEIENLIDTFVIEIDDYINQSESQIFRDRLENILSRMVNTHYSIEVFYTVLLVLQKEITDIFHAGAINSWLHDLFQHTYFIASDFFQRFLISEKQRATYLDNLLIDINQEMATALQVNDLVEVLEKNLPRLGIPACFLALYENAQIHTETARIVFAYGKNGRIDTGPDGFRFHTRELYPESMYYLDEPSSVVVQPLLYQEEELGYVVFETGPVYGGLYEALRESISSTLKKIQLHQRVNEALKMAEESNQLKSRFLAMVTHELRTPLSMIVSLSEMLLEDQQNHKPALPVEFRQELEVILATGKHLDRLVLDVLDLGRSQLGQLKLDLQLLDIRELLAEIQPVAEQMAQNKNLSWRAHIPTSIPPVKGDRTRLRQVLFNLISNACKFTTQGSVSLMVTVGDKEITIAISDTGLGIPLEEQGTIFNEFYQSQRTAARGYGGMGLGLAITRRLVELHGGKIGLISSGQEGSGTTFYFTLPIQPGDLSIYSKVNDGNISENHVLIISQTQSTGELLSNHLGKQGFKVVNIEIDPENTWVNTIMSIPCGAIVLDCEPAAEWGLELMKNLRLRKEMQDIPIFFYNLLPEKNSGAFLDVNYLTKPLNSEALVQAMAQYGITQSINGGIPTTILVVDDEIEALRLNVQFVKEHFPSCKVIEAVNGRQALEQMEKDHPDLILLDLMMPELDGFGVLQAMQTHESLRAIPVIVMTGQVMTEDTVLRLSRSVAAILQKGMFSIEEILTQVEAALSRNKRLGSESQRIARRAMAYIHANYAEFISRENIAQHIGVNERYMTHCFKLEFGVTPIKYLNRYRIQVAKQLLDTENKNITEIGMDVGFTNSANFYRVFHDEVGMSPREYLHKKR